MTLVPYEQFTIEVDAPPAEVVDRLRSAVESGWIPLGSTLPLRGTVSESGFSVRRAIRYKNSFLPRMRGTVEPDRAGSRVRVSMTLHPLVAVFMAVWLSGVGLGAVSALASGDPITVGSAVLMLLGGGALTAVGYGIEVGPSRRALTAAVTGRSG